MISLDALFRALRREELLYDSLVFASACYEGAVHEGALTTRWNDSSVTHRSFIPVTRWIKSI